MHFDCTIAEEWCQVNRNMRLEKLAIGHSEETKGRRSNPITIR